MKITLYNAISIDGFIAMSNGDSEWVSDVDGAIFDETCKKAGTIILGRTTFDQFQGELYPMDDVLNIVLSTDTSKKSTKENMVFVESIENAVSELMKTDRKEAILVGGGKTNKGFLEKGLIDEVILTMHPISLGSGISLFEGSSSQLGLEFKSSKELSEGLVQLKYHVKK